MTIFKTWLTAYILTAFIFLVLLGTGIGSIAAGLAFLFSLPSMLLLLLFWRSLRSGEFSKAQIIGYSVLASVFISAICSILAIIGFREGKIDDQTFTGFVEFILIPILPAILSIIINQDGIYKFYLKRTIK